LRRFENKESYATHGGSGFAILEKSKSVVSYADGGGSQGAQSLMDGLVARGVVAEGGDTWGSQYAKAYMPTDVGGSRQYVKLFTIDGVGAAGGGWWQGFLAGTGDYGDQDRGLLFLSAGQRGSNSFGVQAFQFNVHNTADPVDLYYLQQSEFVFDVWVRLSDYTQTHYLHALGSLNAAVAFDAQQTAAPTGSGSLTAVTPSRIPQADSIAAYTPTNVATDRAFNANSTSTAELADVLGTLIADLQGTGLLQ